MLIQHLSACPAHAPERAPSATHRTLCHDLQSLTFVDTTRDGCKALQIRRHRRSGRWRTGTIHIVALVYHALHEPHTVQHHHGVAECFCYHQCRPQETAGTFHTAGGAVGLCLCLVRPRSKVPDNRLACVWMPWPEPQEVVCWTEAKGPCPLS